MEDLSDRTDLYNAHACRSYDGAGSSAWYLDQRNSDQSREPIGNEIVRPAEASQDPHLRASWFAANAAPDVELDCLDTWRCICST